MYQVDNAIILAAGMSTRLSPLSLKTHKALIVVREEVLIERQIRQLKEAGISEIIIVTGYKAEDFHYLEDKYHVTLIHNKEFQHRNNHSSIYAAREYLANSFICSCDNFFVQNPFEAQIKESYYASVYVEEETTEWCIREDDAGYINEVSIGGKNSWIMLGHSFWSESFSKHFLEILLEEYHTNTIKNQLWEHIFMRHLNTLHMQIRKYADDIIYEFDTLDELVAFDPKALERNF